VYRRDNPSIARGRLREFYQCVSKLNLYMHVHCTIYSVNRN